MRYLLLLPFLFATASAQGTGSLTGRVTDAATGEALPTAQVIIEGTDLGAATDLDGRYRIIGIPVGTYTVSTRFVGFVTESVVGIEIRSGYTTPQDFKLEDSGVLTDVGGCIWEPPIINRDPFASRVVYGEDIQNLPVER